MKLIIESENLNDYLKRIQDLIDWNYPEIEALIAEINQKCHSEFEKIRFSFNYVRDEIQHSFDTKSLEVTISAADAISKKEGICFAKAHLLATLLRGLGIPTGFCYQRVAKKGTPDSGFALHGLNAVYQSEKKAWIRLDPRGNKTGVYSEFNGENEVLAYPTRENWGEIDYPNVYAEPLPEVIESMKSSENCAVLFDKRPEKIN